jgi:hypothetical protein
MFLHIRFKKHKEKNIAYHNFNIGALFPERGENLNGHICSLPLRRVHGIKRMHLASCTHGLFIT